MHVEPLTTAIGAEIADVDLAGSISDEIANDMRSALLQHHVLFFRNPERTS